MLTAALTVASMAGGMFGKKSAYETSSATSGGRFRTGTFGDDETYLYLIAGAAVLWLILRKK